jgi:hypothetical protein
MANLEQILAETSKSYDNSRNALNNQINAISGDLDAQKQRINAQYAQQGKALDNQRNWQAQASSMAASRNGGSFGGKSEIANKKYYQQQFVPAVTQMQTNQANDLSSAESQANQHRQSLEQTLAGLNDEATRYGMQRYDAAVAAEEARRQWEAEMAEKKRQFDAELAESRAARAAANSWQNYLNQTNNNNQTVKSWNFGNGYQLVQNPNGEAEYYVNGNKTNAYDFLVGTGGNNTDWNKWNDVWNNGVSTRGINGNTIGGINNFLNTGIYNSSYDYLRGL